MSAAGRQALWDREQAELPPRDPGRKGPPRGRDKLPGRYDVVKVNLDGRRVVVKPGLAWGPADVLAGRLRDRMRDAEVGEGWDYQAVPRTDERHSRGAKGDASLDPSAVANQQGAGGFPARPRAISTATTVAHFGARGKPGVRQAR